MRSLRAPVRSAGDPGDRSTYQVKGPKDIRQSVRESGLSDEELIFSTSPSLIARLVAAGLPARVGVTPAQVHLQRVLDVLQIRAQASDVAQDVSRRHTELVTVFH